MLLFASDNFHFFYFFPPTNYSQSIRSIRGNPGLALHRKQARNLFDTSRTAASEKNDTKAPSNALFRTHRKTFYYFIFCFWETAFAFSLLSFSLPGKKKKNKQIKVAFSRPRSSVSAKRVKTLCESSDAAWSDDDTVRYSPSSSIECPDEFSDPLKFAEMVKRLDEEFMEMMAGEEKKKKRKEKERGKRRSGGSGCSAGAGKRLKGNDSVRRKKAGGKWRFFSDHDDEDEDEGGFEEEEGDDDGGDGDGDVYSSDDCDASSDDSHPRLRRKKGRSSRKYFSDDEADDCEEAKEKKNPVYAPVSSQTSTIATAATTATTTSTSKSSSAVSEPTMKVESDSAQAHASPSASLVASSSASSPLPSPSNLHAAAGAAVSLAPSHGPNASARDGRSSNCPIDLCSVEYFDSDSESDIDSADCYVLPSKDRLGSDDIIDLT